MLPMQCRKTVLQLAHEVPLAAHLGKNKTAKKILIWFYWPTLYRDVEEFCYHIKKASRQKGSKAPLIPFGAFPTSGNDIVGPLPRTLSGNRYILVMSDYTTRYPEGVPGAGIGSPEVPAEIIILGKFLDVMSSIPGCTTEVEHKVTTTGTRPVRLTSYKFSCLPRPGRKGDKRDA